MDKQAPVAFTASHHSQVPAGAVAVTYSYSRKSNINNGASIIARGRNEEDDSCCIIPFCDTKEGCKAVSPSGTEIRLYRFPFIVRTQSNNVFQNEGVRTVQQELIDKWVAFVRGIKQQQYWTPNKSRICSRHFEDDCLTFNKKLGMLLPSPTAIPTIPANYKLEFDLPREDGLPCCSIPFCSFCPPFFRRIITLGVTYFNFPQSDPLKAGYVEGSLVTREKWIDFVRKARNHKTWTPHPSDKLCSRHFEQECFHSFHPNHKLKNRLNQDAVPTLNLHILSSDLNNKSTTTATPQKTRSRKQTLNAELPFPTRNMSSVSSETNSSSEPEKIKCSIPSCNKKYTKATKCGFFRFPATRDLSYLHKKSETPELETNAQLRGKVWIKIVRELKRDPYWSPGPNDRICELHFEDKYKIGYVKVFPDNKGRPYLSTYAFPTLRLTDPSEADVRGPEPEHIQPAVFNDDEIQIVESQSFANNDSMSSTISTEAQNTKIDKSRKLRSKCAIPHCTNKYKSPTNDVPSIAFYKFPSSESINQSLQSKRQIWINIVRELRGEEDWLPHKSAMICQDHFEECFTGRKEDIKFLNKRHLFGFAVPTLCLKPLDDGRKSVAMQPDESFESGHLGLEDSQMEQEQPEIMDTLQERLNDSGDSDHRSLNSEAIGFSWRDECEDLLLNDPLKIDNENNSDGLFNDLLHFNDAKADEENELFQDFGGQETLSSKSISGQAKTTSNIDLNMEFPSITETGGRIRSLSPIRGLPLDSQYCLICRDTCDSENTKMNNFLQKHPFCVDHDIGELSPTPFAANYFLYHILSLSQSMITTFEAKYTTHKPISDFIALCPICRLVIENAIEIDMQMKILQTKLGKLTSTLSNMIVESKHRSFEKTPHRKFRQLRGLYKELRHQIYNKYPNQECNEKKRTAIDLEDDVDDMIFSSEDENVTTIEIESNYNPSEKADSDSDVFSVEEDPSVTKLPVVPPDEIPDCQMELEINFPSSEEGNTKTACYKCNFCSKTFTSQSSFSSHLQIVHDKHCKFSCYVCQKEFQSLSKCNSHISAAHPPSTSYTETPKEKSKVVIPLPFTNIKNESRKWYCTQCHLEFLSLGGLLKHKASHRHKKSHFQKNLMCTVPGCGEVRLSESSMTAHQRLSHPTGTMRRIHQLDPLASLESNSVPSSSTYLIDLPSAVTDTTGVQNDHTYFRTKPVVVKPPEPPRQCPECSRVFATRLLLNAHIHRLHKPKPFKCDRCPYEYHLEGELAAHVLNIHELGRKGLPRPFACPTCDKRFAKKVSVKIHMAIHEDKTFLCGNCGKIFKSKPALNKHERVVHNTDAEKLAQLKARRKMNRMRAHEQRRQKRIEEKKRKKKRKSPENDVSLSSIPNPSSSVSVGVETETEFKCTECDQSFRSSNNLRIHSWSHKPSRKKKRNNDTEGEEEELADI